MALKVAVIVLFCLITLATCHWVYIEDDDIASPTLIEDDDIASPTCYKRLCAKDSQCCSESPY